MNLIKKQLILKFSNSKKKQKVKKNLKKFIIKYYLLFIKKN